MKPVTLTFTPQILILTYQQHTAFENLVGKGEIARNEQFLHFSQYVLLNQIIVSPFACVFAIISLFAAELEEPKICISGKWLRFKNKQYSCLVKNVLMVQTQYLLHLVDNYITLAPSELTNRIYYYIH